MSWFGSSTRKTTIFYVVLVAMASLVVGMVIASRLDLSSDVLGAGPGDSGDEQRSTERTRGRHDIP